MFNEILKTAFKDRKFYISFNLELAEKQEYIKLTGKDIIRLGRD